MREWLKWGLQLECAPGFVCKLCSLHRCMSLFILSMWPSAPPQPHVPGALHDVPDGTTARRLLAPAHLLQEFPAGWRWWRYHVGDEWLFQQRLLHPLQEDQASCCYSWNFSSQEEAARRYCTHRQQKNWLWVKWSVVQLMQAASKLSFLLWPINTSQFKLLNTCQRTENRSQWEPHKLQCSTALMLQKQGWSPD